MFILLAVLAISCRQPGREGTVNPAGKETIIMGRLSGGQNMEVLLEEMGSREYIPVDTVRCNDDGAFRIAFYPNSTAFYVLRTGGQGYLTLLMEPGEILELEGEYAYTGSMKLEGSPGSEQLAILDAEHKKALAGLRERSEGIREARDLVNYREIRGELDRQMDSITREFRSYSLDFIEKNKPSPVILVALYNLYGRDFPVFDPQEDFHIYLRVDSILQQSHPSLEAARELHTQLLEVRASLGKGSAASSLEVGQIAPDFVSSRPDGSSMALSDLKGKWVLLGFWAAWSKPGVEDLGELQKAWNSIEEKNLAIMPVSFDRERDTWITAIGEEEKDWYHVSDLNGWDSPLADLYRVERIPGYYLVDPEGRIAAKGSAVNEMIDIIQALIK